MKKRPPHELGFLDGHEDALADELGAEFVETVTSGGADHGVELRDAWFDEEIGGPFLTDDVDDDEN
jgi:hypothetical protein